MNRYKITGSPLYILIDADMIIFESCSSCETEVDWGKGLYTLQCNTSDAKYQVDSRVQDIIMHLLDKLNFEGEYQIVMCLSDPSGSNFRKRILSSYKENRAGKRKPLGYGEVRDWVLDNYDCVWYPSLEADDVVGILATRNKGNEVHVSGDKDYKSIPGLFYDFLHNELYDLSVEDADRWFFIQTLAGDSADNYAGCPGVGVKTAEKILDVEGSAWQTVENTFIKKGLTREDALQQARVAHILREGDYSEKEGRIFLYPKQL